MYKCYSKRWANALYAIWQVKQVDRYGVAALG